MSLLLDYVTKLPHGDLADAYWKLNAWEWPEEWPGKPHFWERSSLRSLYQRHGFATAFINHIERRVPRGLIEAARPRHVSGGGMMTIKWLDLKERLCGNDRRMAFALMFVAGLVTGFMGAKLSAEPAPVSPEASYHAFPDRFPYKGDTVAGEALFEFRPAGVVAECFEELVSLPADAFHPCASGYAQAAVAGGGDIRDDRINEFRLGHNLAVVGEFEGVIAGWLVRGVSAQGFPNKDFPDEVHVSFLAFFVGHSTSNEKGSGPGVQAPAAGTDRGRDYEH